MRASMSDWLTASEAAAYCRYGSVRGFRRAGPAPDGRRGAAGDPLWLRATLDAWLTASLPREDHGEDDRASGGAGHLLGAQGRLPREGEGPGPDGPAAHGRGAGRGQARGRSAAGRGAPARARAPRRSRRPDADALDLRALVAGRSAPTTCAGPSWTCSGRPGQMQSSSTPWSATPTTRCGGSTRRWGMPRPAAPWRAWCGW